jgi:hypothetical protein
MAKRGVSSDPALEQEVEVSTTGGDVVVTFVKSWGVYNAGEAAAFSAEDATRLVQAGLVTGPADPPQAE